MASYLDEVAKAIGPDSIENPDAFSKVSAMLNDLHKLNTDLYYPGPNADLMKITEDEWKKYIKQFGGPGSQVDKAY
jgi:hypothetical protein